MLLKLGPAGRQRLRERVSARVRRPFARVAPRLLGLGVILTAFFAIVLWPSRSFAAIVPACENDFVSRVVAPDSKVDAQQQDTSCDGDVRGDDIDNSRVAPICDLRGASAIAPPRLHGVSDVRLDRGRPCEGTDTFKTAVEPHRGDPPVAPPQAIVEHAVLPSLEPVGPVAEPRLIEFPARTDGPRTGVRSAIYHPPR